MNIVQFNFDFQKEGSEEVVRIHIVTHDGRWILIFFFEFVCHEGWKFVQWWMKTDHNKSTSWRFEISNLEPANAQIVWKSSFEKIVSSILDEHNTMHKKSFWCFESWNLHTHESIPKNLLHFLKHAPLTQRTLMHWYHWISNFPSKNVVLSEFKFILKL